MIEDFETDVVQFDCSVSLKDSSAAREITVNHGFVMITVKAVGNGSHVASKLLQLEELEQYTVAHLKQYISDETGTQKETIGLCIRKELDDCLTMLDYYEGGPKLLVFMIKRQSRGGAGNRPRRSLANYETKFFENDCGANEDNDGESYTEVEANDGRLKPKRKRQLKRKRKSENQTRCK